ncbi:hypothetical protein [Parachitinimonas caeni]|uniref:Uncharacterized protein n=1 Tax=Parachitinimonas caeni TaxID=3031301 RepID=A0ABT7DTN3_9NEIS|nr:hypothetical protein [Parachitinimonas caeni]MDK2123441.1 hypothetical protein [Parachitinimonas caeni]
MTEFDQADAWLDKKKNFDRDFIYILLNSAIERIVRGSDLQVVLLLSGSTPAWPALISLHHLAVLTFALVFRGMSLFMFFQGASSYGNRYSKVV